MPIQPYIPESAMAIVAHPDDIEFGSAGTLARGQKQAPVYPMCFAPAGMWALQTLV